MILSKRDRRTVRLFLLSVATVLLCVGLCSCGPDHSSKMTVGSQENSKDKVIESSTDPVETETLPDPKTEKGTDSTEETSDPFGTTGTTKVPDNELPRRPFSD